MSRALYNAADQHAKEALAYQKKELFFWFDGQMKEKDRQIAQLKEDIERLKSNHDRESKRLKSELRNSQELVLDKQAAYKQLDQDGYERELAYEDGIRELMNDFNSWAAMKKTAQEDWTKMVMNYNKQRQPQDARKERNGSRRRRPKQFTPSTAPTTPRTGLREPDISTSSNGKSSGVRAGRRKNKAKKNDPWGNSAVVIKEEPAANSGRNNGRNAIPSRRKAREASEKAAGGLSGRGSPKTHSRKASPRNGASGRGSPKTHSRKASPRNGATETKKDESPTAGLKRDDSKGGFTGEDPADAAAGAQGSVVATTTTPAGAIAADSAVTTGKAPVALM
jgi:hypothetical protein